MSARRLKSEQIHPQRPADNYPQTGDSGSINAGEQQQERPFHEDVSSHNDVFGPPPLPTDGCKHKSKVCAVKIRGIQPIYH